MSEVSLECMTTTDSDMAVLPEVIFDRSNPVSLRRAMMMPGHIAEILSKVVNEPKATKACVYVHFRAAVTHYNLIYSQAGGILSSYKFRADQQGILTLTETFNF